MSYSSSVTTVLQKCPEFTHSNLIATWKLSRVVCPLIIFVAVIILLRFAHVIFIEINVGKIINAFTKILFVNVVNVYHIYGEIQLSRQRPACLILTGPNWYHQDFRQICHHFFSMVKYKSVNRKSLNKSNRTCTIASQHLNVRLAVTG